MSMTTQCPSCGTMFRVTPLQLQAQHGMVRCGRCATVFDGFKALATLPVETPPEPLPRGEPPLPADEPPRPEPVQFAEPAEPAPATAEEVLPDASAAEIEAVEAAPAEPAAAPAETETIEREAAPITPVVQAQFEEPHAESISTFTPPDSKVPLRRKVGWMVGSLVLLLVLGAQFIYLYRGDIAAAAPEARPLLAAWCKSLQCTVALPQQPRQISIEASDMQAADTANPGLIILTATLRNQATITLGYPALDVVLTNTREHTVARRIFLPAEYLAGNNDWRAGIAPSAEITIRLNIDSGDLGAAGFRLELMSAPAT